MASFFRLVFGYEDDDADSRTTGENTAPCQKFKIDPVQFQYCMDCGKHEFEHLACEKFDEDKDDEFERCANCGLDREGHSVCSFFNPSSASSDRCSQCTRPRNAHRSCDLYHPTLDSEDCESCYQHRDLHYVCNEFKPSTEAGDGLVAIFGLCSECHQTETKHSLEFKISQLLRERFPDDLSVSQRTNKMQIASLTHPHDEQPHVQIQFFIDGRNYFEDVCGALECAQREVFITGWWISPEIYLRRPDPGNPAAKHSRSFYTQSRLDTLLLQRASEGVHIYILAWNEAKFGIKFSNNTTKEYLEGLHPNIHMIVHPDSKILPLQKWTHHEKFVCIDRVKIYLGGVDLCVGRYDTPEHVLVDDCFLFTTWPGKDYYNPCVFTPDSFADSFVDCLDRSSMPRMPWHDVQIALFGLDTADIVEYFISKWNFACKDLRIEQAYPRLSHFYTPSSSSRASPVPSSSMSSVTFSHNRISMPTAVPTFSVSCEFVRSVSQWSGGCFGVEASIQHSYVHHILNAKHFIYIENQFFVSSPITTEIQDGYPCNSLSLAIFSRLCRAIREKSNFRIIILLPINPEGNIFSDVVVRYTMYNEYRTISGHPDSLLNALHRLFPDVDLSKYILFCSLRTHGKIGDSFVTEMVYVHSKLMIVDDRVVLIGSANINDRSMAGDRDSEIAVVLRDEEFVSGVMDGKDYEAGKLAKTLRVHLWAEHLGLSPSESHFIADPVHTKTFDLFATTARTNTEIYETFFPKIPADDRQTLESAQYESTNEIPPDEIEHGLAGVRGHVVITPISYLSEVQFNVNLVDNFIPALIADVVQ